MADTNSLTVDPPASPPAFSAGIDGNPWERVRAFMAQPAVRKSLPMAMGLVALAGAGLMYMALASGPQRVLYSSLNDAERADVAAVLDSSGLSYNIDHNTGSLTVAEDDLYRARMLVASDGGLAAPESTAQMLDAIPIGSSRTLEGERLRNVRERELTMTIMEIDGVEAVRVHLAQQEKSVFVRENAMPSASVMVRMARGRTLGENQVNAIVNLVAGSTPGMTPDAVRVADQNGNLLSERRAGTGLGLELQAEYESKMRAQIAQLLVPMLGEDNFSTQVQVELDMEDTTSARESYDKDGAVRSETSRESSQMGGNAARGVPGTLANTPPPDAQVATPGADDGQAEADPDPINDERSTQRTYELGREVAVSTSVPGSVKRVSVAVAINSEALKNIAPTTAEQIEELVASAVGAIEDRGDQVTVMAGKFEPTIIEEAPFYETGWFAMVVRNAVALIAVILALLLGARPLIKAIAGRKQGDDDPDPDPDADQAEGTDPELVSAQSGSHLMAGNNLMAGPANLQEQVELAQKLAIEQPDRAVQALRRMLASPDNETST